MRLSYGLWSGLLSAVAIFACSTDSEPPPAALPIGDAGAAADSPAQLTPEASCAVDPRTDAKNCGRCGHDCLGGSCAAGACQPVRLAVDRSNLTWMTIDAMHVYFCEGITQRLGRVPKGGGPIELVSSTCGKFVDIAAVVDDTNIYVNDPPNGIHVVPKQGLGSGTLTASPGIAVAVDKANLYLVGSFIFPQPIGVSAALERSDKPAGAPYVIGPLRSPLRYAQDATTIYVVDTDGIRQFPKNLTAGVDAGSPLIVSVLSASDVAVDGTSVYYTSPPTGSVKRVSKANGSVEVVASGVDSPSSLAVDASGTYFASAQAGLILSCPPAGCTGNPTVLAEREAGPLWVAVDDVAVYWITQRGGTVMRVAK